MALGTQLTHLLDDVGARGIEDELVSGGGVGDHVGLLVLREGVVPLGRSGGSPHAGTQIVDAGVVPGLTDLLRALGALEAEDVVTDVGTADRCGGHVVLDVRVRRDDLVDEADLARRDERSVDVVHLGTVGGDDLVGVHVLLLLPAAVVADAVIEPVGHRVDGVVEVVAGLVVVHGVLLGDLDVDGLVVDELGVVGTAQVDGGLLPRLARHELDVGLGQGVQSVGHIPTHEGQALVLAGDLILVVDAAAVMLFHDYCPSCGHVYYAGVHIYTIGHTIHTYTYHYAYIYMVYPQCTYTHMCVCGMYVPMYVGCMQ